MIEFRLDRHQTKAFNLLKPGRVVTLPWGRGSGKSYLGRAFIHTEAFTYPGIHIGVLMPSLKMAKRVFWKDLLKDYFGPLKGHVHTPNRTELVCQYRNGSMLTTWGAENADSIRGQRFGRLVEDESDDISPEVEQAVVEPTFSRSGVESIWMKTGTPKRGRYGALYKSFARIGNGRHYGFRLASAESPQVDQVWLDALKADPNTNAKIFAREYECSFDATSGLVYGDVFDEDFHVRPAPSSAPDEWCMGVDFGYEHPTVFVRGAVYGKGRDATIHIVEEWVQSKVVAADIAEKAASWVERYGMGDAPWYCDHARPEAIEVMRRRGVNAVNAHKDVEDGIQSVADMLFVRDDERRGRYAKLYIDPSCVRTIRGFVKYRRRADPGSDGEFLDEVVKEDDDEMDALRYLVFSRAGRPPSRTPNLHSIQYEATSIF